MAEYYRELARSYVKERDLELFMSPTALQTLSRKESDIPITQSCSESADDVCF